jgi:hypothetical protein
MADAIPFGQPILVGHHSEGRDRRYRDRIHGNMAKGCEEQSLAKHHAAAADGIERALERSIFSDDPDAIEALTAKLAALEAERERIKAHNARCRKGDPDAIAAIARRCNATADDPRKGYPPYMLRNLAGEIGRVKRRIEDVRSRQQRTAAAEAAPAGVVIEGGDYVGITFAEKPARSILDAIKAAGFHWRGGRWLGHRSRIPADVLALASDQGGNL